MQGDWAWHELMTSDTAASEKFYAKILGWKSRKMSMGDGPPYTVFTQGGKDHGGMMKIDPTCMPGVPPHWLIYIAVTDVDRTASAAAKSGGSVLVPPSDIPGIGRFAIINDPAGATFGIYRSNM
jgi:predicted enzyme related to lactoylglutathione lyase